MAKRKVLDLNKMELVEIEVDEQKMIVYPVEIPEDINERLLKVCEHYKITPNDVINITIDEFIRAAEFQISIIPTIRGTKRRRI